MQGGFLHRMTTRLVVVMGRFLEGGISVTNTVLYCSPFFSSLLRYSYR